MRKVNDSMSSLMIPLRPGSARSRRVLGPGLVDPFSRPEDDQARMVLRKPRRGETT